MAASDIPSRGQINLGWRWLEPVPLILPWKDLSQDIVVPRTEFPCLGLPVLPTSPAPGCPQGLSF